MSTREVKPALAHLALYGGPPACPEGRPQWPPVDEDIQTALNNAYVDGSWGRYHGPNVANLAAALAEYHSVEFVTLCCSGTLAVELALHGLNIGAEDEVVLAGYDFSGNFHSVLATGATPVIVDVDQRNWNFDPNQLEGAIGPRTKAVVVSHLHGGLVPMRALMETARRHGLAVVEDACQAPGALVEGRRAGTWGDVGVLSFGGSKLLTAGRGGAVITARADVQQRIKIYSDRGNQVFPMSELQAAVLLPQLRKLDARNAKRHLAVEQLLAHWKELPALRPLENRPLDDSQPAYYKLGLRYDSEALDGLSRDELIRALAAEGVGIDAGFRDFAKRSPRRCRHVGTLKHSRRAGEAMLVLHHPVLLEGSDMIRQVAAAVEKVVTALAAN